jgi:competence protein ComEC
MSTGPSTLHFAYAPLLPTAAAATVGLVADRYLFVPIPFSLAAAILCLIGSSIAQRLKQDLVAAFALWACCAGIGAAYHHGARHVYAADDIGELAGDEPTLVRVQGVLTDEPFAPSRRKNDPLVSRPRVDAARATLKVTAIACDGGDQPASGNLALHVDGKLDGLHTGDEIQVTGWLTRPVPPMNPGEYNYASRLLDRRIRAEMRVRKNEDGVVRLVEGWRNSFFGWLAYIRGWGQRAIQQSVAPEDAGVAAALLLGEGSNMTSDDWERYVRTGVIHVLAISGQHLVVLGSFLWLVARLAGVRRRRSAIFVAAIMIGYALLTGGQPSAMRAGVMVGAVCLGIVLRRPALPANTFALAWLVVLALDPTDLFTAGFQLSFLCVAVLIWGMPRWFPRRERTPLEQLVDESRPAAVRLLRGALHTIGQCYLITLVLMICTAPLVIFWQNVISPAGLLIGPVAIFLTSIALISGFMLLLASLLGAWAAVPFAWVTQVSLAACECVVHAADRMPGGCWYVPDIPVWWLIIFYAALFAWMAAVRRDPNAPPRRSPFVPLVRAPAFATAVGLWAAVGLLAGAWKPAPDELRISFVAVGHGGCTVIETLDGRVLLYDAGSLSGPEVTRRHIAPFLWSRGISRIDEIFISHADLDHFNGLPALADRFVIGQITWTPTFELKPTPGVAFVVGDMRRRGIPIRQVRAGDRYVAGEVELRVLHPPPAGPEGPENARSMVLLVAHQGHHLLLTGDLELKGLEWLLDLPPIGVDVLMAPHHGSRTANPDRLADWAKPRLVIACDGPRPLGLGPDTYTRKNIPYWITWPHGTITLRSHRTGLIAETYRSGQRMVVTAGAGR